MNVDRETNKKNKTELQSLLCCIYETNLLSLSLCLLLHRVLLRVRMLYYLKVEVLGEAASQALEGIPARYGACTMC